MELRPVPSEVRDKVVHEVSFLITYFVIASQVMVLLMLLIYVFAIVFRMMLGSDASLNPLCPAVQQPSSSRSSRTNSFLGFLSVAQSSPAFSAARLM